MYKKLIGDLRYSPSLSGEFAVHVRRLRRESRIRLAGVIVLSLVLSAQVVTAFTPAGIHIGTVRDSMQSAGVIPASNTMISRSMTVSNLSTTVREKTTLDAGAGDRLEYTLSARNTATTAMRYRFELPVDDLLRYATVVDGGGADLNGSPPSLLEWPSVTIGSGQTATERFVVRVMAPVPATAVNPSAPAGYDCRMTGVFGSVTTVDVACPVLKRVEHGLRLLPDINSPVAILTTATGFVLAIVLYVRSRQLGRELRTIRRDNNSGAI